MNKKTKEIDKVISEIPGLGEIWKVYNKTEALDKISKIVGEEEKLTKSKIKKAESGDTRAIIVWPPSVFTKYLYAEVQGQLVRVVMLRETDKNIPDDMRTKLFPKIKEKEKEAIGESIDLFTEEKLRHFNDGTTEVVKSQEDINNEHKINTED